MATEANLSRRRFLKKATAASVLSTRAWYSAPASATESHRSAHDTIRLGVIGTGMRGKYLIGNLPPSARVAAICDSAQSRMADTLKPRGEFKAVLQNFRESDAAQCATYRDYRKMLDEQQLDAVIIATPDHHHAQAGLLAMQAGMDVYIEKPLSVTILEGRMLANMVEKTGRVVQVGSQQRTMEFNRFACEFIRDGGLGEVQKVELPNYPGPIGDPSLPAEPVPNGLDWDLFLGPTRRRDHNRKLWVKDEFRVGDLLWRGWDVWRPFSGHMMTNWGAHSVDMVQYALGRDDTGPVEIRVVKPDSLEPIWQEWRDKTPRPTSPEERRFWPVVMRYADGVELHFIGGTRSMLFHGTKGRMRMGRNTFTTDPEDLVKNAPDESVKDKWKGAGYVAKPHLENWLQCIRTRGLPNAPIEVGHRTATVCHLANIVRELSRPLTWDPKTERFTDDDQADRRITRPRRDGFKLPV